MSTLNRAILKSCLLESTLQEIREIEAINYSYIKADDEFKSRILDVINNAKNKTRSKRITFSLIAAIIICFSIILSVSARVRTAIASFFVEIYDSFAVFFIENEDDSEDLKPIETIYEPAYFEENGYKQSSQELGKFRSLTVWTNDTITIDLSQYSIHNNMITSDAENMSYEITYIGERKVYYAVKNDMYFVKWLEHEYSFNIRCDSSLEWSEIEKIISSLQPATK